jgi:preprotein translocase subunit SecA
MAHLREGINLRAMGQRDPLIEWQQEGFNLFSEMIQSLNVDYVRYMMHVEVVQPAPAPAEGEAAKADASTATGRNGKSNGNGTPAAAKVPAGKAANRPAGPVTTDLTATAGEEPAEAQAAGGAAGDQPFVKDEWDKTPRNAPCPCGSGKKFKQCHGR